MPTEKATRRCWAPLHGYVEATGSDHEGTDPDDAAVAFAEAWFSDGEAPRDLVVCVRDGAAVRRYVVSPEYSVSYYATEVAPPPFPVTP